jgi:hypothetical protein
MSITNEAFRTGERAAVTDGERKVTFDTPSDFADWLSRRSGDLAEWQWVRP